MDTGDFTKTLFSPPVIIIGGAIGLMLLLTSGAKAGGTSSSGVNPTLVSANVQMNQAALSAQTQLAGINAQYGADLFNQDTIRQGQLLSYLKSVNDNNAVIENARITSEAGITNNIITQGSALAQDINNNYTRLSMTYVAAHVAEDQIVAQQNIANIQAKAQEKVARSNAIAQVFGSVSKIITSSIGF